MSVIDLAAEHAPVTRGLGTIGAAIATTLAACRVRVTQLNSPGAAMPTTQTLTATTDPFEISGRTISVEEAGEGSR